MKDGDYKRMFPDVEYSFVDYLECPSPGLVHTQARISGFHFADRLDVYALVEPGKRALLIDTGWWELCGTDFLDDLMTRFDVAWSDVDVALTHLHRDHDGNLAHCIRRGVRRVFVGPYSRNDASATDAFLTFAGCNRAGDESAKETIASLIEDGEAAIAAAGDKVIRVAEHDGFDDDHAINIAGYRLVPLATPGHTEEHVCFVDPEKKVIFAGDHIIDAAPGLMTLRPDFHLLKRFLDTFPFIESLGLETAYLSHHEPLRSTDEITALCRAIVTKYDKPIERARSLFASDSEGLTPYEFARRFFEKPGRTIDQEPDYLRARRIATGLSYLEYLVDTGYCLRRTDDDGAFVYERMR